MFHAQRGLRNIFFRPRLSPAKLFYVVLVFFQLGVIQFDSFVPITLSASRFSINSTLPPLPPPPLNPSLMICYFVDENRLDQALLSAYSVARVVRGDRYTSTMRIFIYNKTTRLSLSTKAQVQVIQTINPTLRFCLDTFDMRFDDQIPHYLPNSPYPRIILARLFVAQIVTQDYILYLDSDTLCGRDFTVEIGPHLNPSKVLHAVQDIGNDVLWMRRYFRHRGIDGTLYINSGVLFMRNCKLLNILFMRALQWTHENSNVTRNPDQDSLYFIFGSEHMHLLPKNFNCYHCKRFNIEDANFHHGKQIHPLRQMREEFDELVDKAMNQSVLSDDGRYFCVA
jgi:lipopolysaccharide biosynthesis glycosyltransferase